MTAPKKDMRNEKPKAVNSCKHIYAKIANKNVKNYSN